MVYNMACGKIWITGVCESKHAMDRMCGDVVMGRRDVTLTRSTSSIRCVVYFFFSSRRRHTILQGDWSSDVCSSDLYDQDLRFGAGNARGAFWVVDVLEAGGYDGPVHFDYKPPRTEDDDGVWESAAACMRNYLILREKVRAFRSDPEVIKALADSKVAALAEPTLGGGETWRE